MIKFGHLFLGRTRFLADYGVLFLCHTKRDETLTEAQILQELNVQVMNGGKYQGATGRERLIRTRLIRSST